MIEHMFSDVKIIMISLLILETEQTEFLLVLWEAKEHFVKLYVRWTRQDSTVQFLISCSKYNYLGCQKAFKLTYLGPNMLNLILSTWHRKIYE